MRFLFIVAALAGGLAVLLTPNDWSIHGYPPDGGSDKYTTLAAWEGTDAHANMDEVFARYDADGFTGAAAPIPRPPFAFLLHGPLVILPDQAVIPVVGLLSVAAIVTTCWAAARISGLPPWWLALLAIAIASASNYWYANLGFLIPALISLAWLSLKERRTITSGVLFGIAAAVKAWPLILVAALFIRRPTRDIAFIAAATVAILTAAGLALPGVTLEGTYFALTEGGGEFIGSDFNRSFAGLAARFGIEPLIGTALALLLWMWSLWTYRDVHMTIALSIVMGLFASPLSWSFYWIAAVPAAAVIGQHLLGEAQIGVPRADPMATLVLPESSIQEPTVKRPTRSASGFRRLLQLPFEL